MTPLRSTLMFALLLTAVHAAVSQEEATAEPGCLSAKVTAVTDRPTPSSSTETTQCGVLEVLGGPERIWLGHGVHQDDIGPSLQFGLTPSLDLHYTRATFFRLGGNPGPLSGAGDTFAGARYKLSKQTKALPSFGTFYTMKAPTGSVAEGFSTGRYDHSLLLLVSKDLPKVHVDFNVGPNLIGRSGASGYDTNTSMLLFGALPVTHTLTFVAGTVGNTTLNADTPGYASATAGFAWQVVPRLILDAGMDEGLTSGAPRKRIAFGFSYAPANLYAIFAGTREHTR